MKYKCPCCGNNTIDEQPPGTFEICSICNWEDDELQYHNPNYKGGANILSLKQAQEKYRKNNKNNK
jgi:hypothetical protein